MEYVTQICKSCKKPFEVMRWKLGQGRGKTCSKECRHVWQRDAVAGEKCVLWKGGFYFDKSGYKLIRAHDHPFKNGGGYVREHRLVMENYLGRYLKPTEIVHHVNQNRVDNRIENLQLLQSNAEHRYLHRKKV